MSYPRYTKQEFAALQQRLRKVEEKEARASAKLVRGQHGKHVPLHGANDGPVPNETGNSVRIPWMARNKATAPVSLRGKSVEGLGGAGRGQAYSPEAGRAMPLRTKESERRTNAGARPAPSPHNRQRETDRMTQSFFVGTVLPNLNDMLAAARASRGKWQRYDQEKALYQSLIKSDIRAARLTPMKRVRVMCLWHEKNRKRDPDNIAAGIKFINDSLVAQGILPNDGWQEILSISHSWVVDPRLPGVLVTLEEV